MVGRSITNALVRTYSRRTKFTDDSQFHRALHRVMIARPAKHWQSQWHPMHHFRFCGFSYQTTFLLVWPATSRSRSPSRSMSNARMS